MMCPTASASHAGHGTGSRCKTSLPTARRLTPRSNLHIDHCDRTTPPAEGSPAGLNSHFRGSARSMEEYGLPDRQSTYASDRAVDSCVVLVRTNDRFHHFGSRTCRIRVQVQHRAPDIALGNRDGWSVVAITEGQHSA